MSPGQGVQTVQSLVEVGCPMQYWPPYLGAGLLQMRSCVCRPTPQVTEQSEKDDQAPQFPFSMKMNVLMY